MGFVRETKKKRGGGLNKVCGMHDFFSTATLLLMLWFPVGAHTGWHAGGRAPSMFCSSTRDDLVCVVMHRHALRLNHVHSEFKPTPMGMEE